MVQHHTHGGKVLVVEDDNDIRDALISTFELEGYTAVAASNGLEALEILGQEPTSFCVIFLDLMMPVMDGATFLQRLREDPSFADIPVVLVSADSNLSRKAADLRAAWFIRKPAMVTELLTALERHC